MEKIMPLKDGTKIYLPPKGKFVLDRDDRAAIKKASFKDKKSFTKKRGSRGKTINAKGLKKVSLKDKKKSPALQYKRT